MKVFYDFVLVCKWWNSERLGVLSEAPPLSGYPPT